MPRIHAVAQDGTITAGDKLIGSDGDPNNGYVTRNYTVGSISNFILSGANAGSFTTATTTGNTTVGADLSVGGNETVTGNLTVTGNITTDAPLNIGSGSASAVSHSDDLVINVDNGLVGLSILANDSTNSRATLTLGNEQSNEIVKFEAQKNTNGNAFYGRINGDLTFSHNAFDLDTFRVHKSMLVAGFKATGTISFPNVSTYADDAAAGAGGLTSGDVYKKSDGTLMIKS